MKKYGTIILILGLIGYLSYILFAQNNTNQLDQKTQDERFNNGNAKTEQENLKAEEPQKMDFNVSEGSSEDVEDENYFTDDQDIFSRKLFQKKLAPLSDKEKIIWAFRLSKTTIFL